jgi:hypothetical protein
MAISDCNRQLKPGPPLECHLLFELPLTSGVGNKFRNIRTYTPNQNNRCRLRYL